MRPIGRRHATLFAERSAVSCCRAAALRTETRHYPPPPVYAERHASCDADATCLSQPVVILRNNATIIINIFTYEHLVFAKKRASICDIADGVEQSSYGCYGGVYGCAEMQPLSVCAKFTPCRSAVATRRRHLFSREYMPLLLLSHAREAR